jgi:hypothetical protein
MKRFALLAAVACLCGCALTGAGRAGSVVYSTFGEPGDTFNTGAGVRVGGSGSDPSFYDAQASAFTPSKSVTLDSLRFAFFTNATGYQIDAVIAANSNGTPGAALETISAISVPTTPIGKIVTVDSATHPELDAGTTYWLVLQPHIPTTSDFGSWDQSSPIVDGDLAARSSPTGAWEGGFGAQAVFDIEGTQIGVPEPASLTLLGVVGAAGLLGYGWRRRR